MLGSIDHVTIAGSDLDDLSAAFDGVGLATEYGGPHSNGTTHMAVVGFGDGSYVELLSTRSGVETSSLWDAHVQNDGGPCAWCVAVDDVESVAATLRSRGVPVEGPTRLTRDRPDGVTVTWDLAFLGDGAPGSTLPFLIEDVTPRERRVTPTGDLAATPLSGVERVVVGVPDLDAAVEEFRTAFDLPAPERGSVDAAPVDFAADLAWFPDAPVVLAQPDDGWLAERVAAFGAAPVAFLLGSDDVEATAERVPLTDATPSFAGASVRWIRPAELGGVRYLGVSPV